MPLVGTVLEGSDLDNCTFYLDWLKSKSKMMKPYDVQLLMLSEFKTEATTQAAQNIIAWIVLMMEDMGCNIKTPLGY